MDSFKRKRKERSKSHGSREDVILHNNNTNLINHDEAPSFKGSHSSLLKHPLKISLEPNDSKKHHIILMNKGSYKDSRESFGEKNESYKDSKEVFREIGDFKDISKDGKDIYKSRKSTTRHTTSSPHKPINATPKSSPNSPRTTLVDISMTQYETKDPTAKIIMSVPTKSKSKSISYSSVPVKKERKLLKNSYEMFSPRPLDSQDSENEETTEEDYSEDSDSENLLQQEETLENKLYSRNVLSIQRKVTGLFLSGQMNSIISDTGKKFFHEPPSIEYFEPKIIENKDLYSEYFYPKVHLNFIAINYDKKDECFVVSVLKRAYNGNYTCLKIDKKGSELFYIKTQDLAEGDKKQSLEESLEIFLSTLYPSMWFYIIHHPNFPQDLRQVEIKHPKQQKAFKIAFLYSNGEEKTLQDFFAHKNPKMGYFNVLNLLGEKINMKGWKKYRGDISYDLEQDSYYTEWNKIEVMFHVSVWMNAEQHRRLIGNDVVFLIYHNSNLPFDPGPLDSLGTVPQVFGVIKQFEDKYRIQFFSRPNIKPYNPPLPANYCFSPEELKDFLLTKAFNGYCQALMCPPMNRLFEVPRLNTLLDLSNKYPRMTKKEINIRRNSSKKRTKLLINKNQRDPLILLVTIVCALPPKNKALTNCYVSVHLENTEQKTKVWKEKKDLKKHPIWNEVLAFPDLIAVDPALSSVKVELRDASKIGNSKIGQAEISFFEICQILNKEHWIELDSEISNQNEVSGVLCLKFNLKGPPALLALCPKCHLYLGGLDLIQYKNVIFHEHCFTCSQCNKALEGSNFVEREHKLYCNRCYSEKNGSPNTQVVAISGFNKIGDSPHNWSECTFKNAFAWCGFCGHYFGLGTHGYQCTECKYPCHKECLDKIPENCSHSPKDQEFHSKPHHEKVKKAVVNITPKSKPLTRSPIQKDNVLDKSSFKSKPLFRRKSDHSPVTSSLLKRTNTRRTSDPEPIEDSESEKKEDDEIKSKSGKTKQIVTKSKKSTKSPGNDPCDSG